MSYSSNICQRVESSISRVVDVKDFSCTELEDGRVVLRGNVASRDEVMMLNLVVRLVPGTGPIVTEVSVAK